MSEFYTVIYSSEAINDIREIYSYIAFELLSQNFADKLVNQIKSTIRSLDFMPMRNPIVDWEPWKNMGMHKMPIDKYIVFYTVANDTQTVTIIRIVYGGRNIKTISSDISDN